MKAKAADLVITASATARKGQEAALEAALREAAIPTRIQRGCVKFVLIRRADDPMTIIGLERWASEADHQEHLKGVHIQTLMQRLGSILAGPPTITTYEVVDG